ncbi:type III-B CRISPR module-associated protein Cmr3 [Candidatus Bathyarchaeota archaeon]|nr:type III-B CRISPR module-associated protein Cmr3 [Candidatus Bathyarchaeota archaeon]
MKMGTKTFIVECRDGIVARDSRPFGKNKGNHAYSLDWPFPSTLAGALRTFMGKRLGGIFDQGMIKKLKNLQVMGGFPTKDGSVYLPAPSDAVFSRDGDYPYTYTRYPVLPEFLDDGEGCDLPAPSLQPAFLSDGGRDDFKPPKESPTFWSLDEIESWLTDQPEPKTFDSVGGHPFMGLPPKEKRVHVSIDPDTRTALEHHLFSISRIALPTGVGLLIGCEYDSSKPGKDLVEELPAHFITTLGGQRRLASWEEKSNGAKSLWSCPGNISHVLGESKAVRMLLVTPALFKNGWVPGWLEKDDAGMLKGNPPSLNAGGGLELELVSACIGNWQPISGWSYETKGEKKLHRLVPAGSVYFFRIASGSANDLEKAWMKAVSDELQDRMDGFGLAVWGNWNGNDES